MRQFDFSTGILLALCTLGIEAKSSAIEPVAVDPVLSCRQEVAPFYTAVVYGISNGFFGSQIRSENDGEVNWVETLHCDTKPIDSEDFRHLSTCSNVDWTNRWNLTFNWSSSSVQAKVIHNEQHLGTMKCTAIIK